MAKKRKKDKEIARFRREIEILRTQLKAGEATPKAGPPKAKEQPTIDTIDSTDSTYLRSNLLKSGILTAIAFAILAALYLTQSRWGKLI